MTFERQATITWEGTVREGQGDVKAGSGAFSLPVNFPSRVSSATDGAASPEELLAAAHASCYAMALAATLGRRGARATRLHVSATVEADFSDVGLVIHSSQLRVMADGLVGLDPGLFAAVAHEAEARCPVSAALRSSVRVAVDAVG